MRLDDVTLRVFAAFATRTLARSHEPGRASETATHLVPDVTELSAPTDRARWPRTSFRHPQDRPITEPAGHSAEPSFGHPQDPGHEVFRL
jgi:hypothetical protein